MVDPSVLEKEDGSPLDGKINISIIELTNSNELFKGNTATVSNGQLLASGGSYFIGMECRGKKLRIKRGKTMQVDFPLLKDDEMELFYGERDSIGTMNWKKTGKVLQQEFEKISFNTTPDYSALFKQQLFRQPGIKINYCLFNSLDTKVFFSNKLMTIREIVTDLHSKGIDRIIDTIYYNWCGRGSKVVYSMDSSFPKGIIYGRQYRIISPKVLHREKDSLAEDLCMKKESLEKANAEYNKAMANIRENDITEQLKKYYAPSTIGSLGWLNCDRFYKSKENTDIDLDIPITLNNSRIEYFIIFRSFNGLINERIDFNEDSKAVLRNLPIGASVTLVAFAKNKGIIYQGREDFVIEKNKKIPVNFKIISKEELNKIFRNNVKA